MIPASGGDTWKSPWVRLIYSLRECVWFSNFHLLCLCALFDPFSRSVLGQLDQYVRTVLDTCVPRVWRVPIRFGWVQLDTLVFVCSFCNVCELASSVLSCIVPVCARVVFLSLK